LIKKIYKYLTRAKTSRKQADYDYGYVLDKEDAIEIYEHALVFINEAEKYL